MNSLNNKVAIITGGTKGIGFGIAQSLMEQGIHVAITGRSMESVNEAARKLNNSSKTNSKAIGLKADVRKLESQQNTVTEVLKHFNKIDYVIANAGLGHF